MATLAKLAVELSLTDKFSQGLNKTKDNLDKWGSSLRATGTKFTLGVTVPVVAGFGLMIKSASDLNEATSATQTVFGDASKSIVDYADKSADAYGITKQDALEAATTLGQLATGLGLTTDEAAKFSVGMISAAGDLASFKNMDPSAVLADIQSGLVGQYEPLLKYGIVLNEATVAQKAMEMSGKANVDQLTNADKVLARSTLITEGLGAAHGDAARTADSLANVIRRLRARGKDLAAKWGQLLLPMVLRFSQFLIRITEALEKLSPKMQILIMVGLALAAAIGPVLIALGLMLPALSVLLGPVGLIIVAVGLLAAAFATDFMGIRGAIGSVLEPLMHLWTYMKLAFTSGTKVSQLVAFLPEPLQRVGKGFLLIADAVGDLVSAFKNNGLSGVLDALPGELGQVWQGLSILASEGFAKLKEAFLAIPWGTIWDGVKDIGSGLKQKIEDIDYTGFGFLIGSGLRTSIETVGPTLLSLGGKAVDFIKTGLTENWKTILLAVALWPVTLVTALGKLGDLLGPSAKEFIGGFLTGIGTSWEEVTAWLNTRDDAALMALGSLIETLLLSGNDLIQGLQDGASEIWADFKTWLGNRALNATFAIGSLAKTLYDKGLSLIQGLRTGALEKWDVFTTWLEGRPDAILGWIGDLGGLLYGAGQDAVQGLIDGAQSRIPGLQATINTLVGMWETIKALGRSPWPMMIGAGKDAVDGLIVGAESRMGALNDTIGNVTAAMLAPTSAGSSTSYSGGISISVSGAGDPNTVADRVFAKFVREMALTTGGA